MSYNDLRKGRFSQPGQIYSITAVVKNRRPIFNDFFMARIAVSQMRYIENDQRVQTIAWVVMPDHIHWLFQLNEGQTLGKVMQLFKGRSACHFNRHTAHTGQFWQPAYYDYAIRKDDDIRKIARYIVANPLRAGLVEKIEDYPHWDAVWL